MKHFSKTQKTYSELLDWALHIVGVTLSHADNNNFTWLPDKHSSIVQTSSGQLDHFRGCVISIYPKRLPNINLNALVLSA